MLKSPLLSVYFCFNIILGVSSFFFHYFVKEEIPCSTWILSSLNILTALVIYIIDKRI